MYEKKTWISQEIITHDALNHMEDGIRAGTLDGWCDASYLAKCATTDEPEKSAGTQIVITTAKAMPSGLSASSP